MEIRQNTLSVSLEAIQFEKSLKKVSNSCKMGGVANLYIKKGNYSTTFYKYFVLL